MWIEDRTRMDMRSQALEQVRKRQGLNKHCKALLCPVGQVGTPCSHAATILLEELGKAAANAFCGSTGITAGAIEQAVDIAGVGRVWEKGIYEL